MKLFRSVFVASLLQQYLQRRITKLEKKALRLQKEFNLVHYDIHINGGDSEALDSFSDEMNKIEEEILVATAIIESIDKVLISDSL
jgi:hypothetical protein